jgi:hypothetical protein
VYVLPVSEAPWPLRVVGWIKVPVKWEGVTFKLSPEANEMEQSGPSKYHISKISKAARAPRYRILAAPYHAM